MPNVPNIEYAECLSEELGEIIDAEFEKFSEENGLSCEYSPFCFIARENGEIAGILKGHSYYEEVHVSDLVVLKRFRGRRIGSGLVRAALEHFRGKGFENINLSTYAVQAPDFYRKCGFQLEYTRENKSDPKLTKYFFIKYF